MGQPEQFDLICVGSGVAGCAAALAGIDCGLKVILVEKSSRLGGGSAFSTGGLWVGANHREAAQGIEDSLEETRTYLEFVAGGAAVRENLNAYVERSPEALLAFERMGLRFSIRPTVPDHYYPQAPGSKAGGRAFGSEPVAPEELGPWAGAVQESPYFPPGISNTDIVAWGGLANMRNWDKAVLKERADRGMLGNGQAAVGQFLAGLVRRNADIRVGFDVRELFVREGCVAGIRGLHGGREIEIEAHRGVVLATGGYEGNPALVDRFEGVPDWHSMFPPGVTGDGMIMATEIGAAVYRTAENYFFFLGYEIPSETPGGDPSFRMTGFNELSYPHTIVVNRRGKRFFDESSFQKGVRPLKAFDTATHAYPNLPCFMILDADYLERYTFASRPPGEPPPDWLIRSDTLTGLADKLGIDAAGLEETVTRFNRHAKDGADPEFGRGEFLWIRTIAGDSSHPIHPNLAPVAQPPFYGVRLYPSGSSSAGLLTNASAQVIHVRGHPIEGLYACGSAAAPTDFGVGYQAGLLLTRGMTFGYVAARHAAGLDG